MGSSSSAEGIMRPLPSTGGELCNKWYNGKLAGFQKPRHLQENDQEKKLSS